ncbi:hypothetical protein METP2_01843 [Methanosarcinales archaeon]|nr:hypothetical protein [Candidatus Methanoperedens sp.]CAG0978863.1 hypothetical protein METP2_01843 [Methanosarcinales archaeon]
MSTERDIIIERLEQKLAARDKEFTQMQEALRESIVIEMEKRFTDKIKLRESTLEDMRTKFGEKINEIIQMNKSLRDSVMEKKNTETSTLRHYETRMERMERRLIELNSAYDGVMKELLDQKSIIQELRPPKPREELRARQEVKPKEEIKRKEEAKPAEKERPKTQYIIADNYVPREKRKQAPIIEANEKPIDADEKAREQQKEQLKKPTSKKSEKIMEGVEISETLRRGK